MCCFILVCALKALTVVCILSSCKPFFSDLSSSSLSGIPVWAGIQLIVDLYVNLDAVSLMALVDLLSPVFCCVACAPLSMNLCVLYFCLLFHWLLLVICV